MKKTIRVGTLKTDPRDLTKAQGHDYGVGRSTSTQKDKRTKRNRTRRAQLRNALKGW